MKTTILSIYALFLMGFNTFSQDKFTTYDNTYISETFEIAVSSEGENDFTLWIDALSLDRLYEVGGIKVTRSQYKSFIDGLKEARTKYIEWVKVAKDNKVDKLTKNMDIRSNVGGYFLTGKDWHFQFLVELSFQFRVLDNKGFIRYYLLVKTGEMKSSSNEYIDVDGVSLVFASGDEIDDFLSVITLDKIAEFLKKPKDEDLFK